jgi:hypothetical protein
VDQNGTLPLDKGPAEGPVPLFVIICAVKGRFLVFLCVAVFARGDALDDAVGQWAKKISSHLAADEIAHVIWTEAGPPDADAAAYLTRAKTLLARALQRRLRNPKPVEITARLSQNLKGYLFIAEMHRENEEIVEIAGVPRPAAVSAASAGFRLDRRLLWEQETPILDVFAAGDQMLVLDTAGVARYEQRESKWQKTEAAALEIPPVRDLRGRLTVTENAVIAEVPGLTCQGMWKPALTLECRQGGRFTAGRNTIEDADWPAYFTHAEIGGDHVIAAADGRTYVYDAARKQLTASGAWNDLVVVSSPCTSPKLIASDSSSNSLAIFELVNHNPVRVSDSTEVPGAVTAMWPAGSSAVAVVRNKSTNRYEAYSIGVACGR